MTNQAYEPKPVALPVELTAELTEETLERLASGMDAQVRMNLLPCVRASYPN